MENRSASGCSPEGSVESFQEPDRPGGLDRRAMKRLRNGGEDSLYVYGRFAAGAPEDG